MNTEFCKRILIENIQQSDDEFECVAQIPNYMNLLEWIAVGEQLETDTFTLWFPNSIGMSQWKLVFYPNGQYHYEIASKHVAIYLILLACDNENKALNANVTFRLKAQYENQNDGYKCLKEHEFVYSIPGKRWIGHQKFAGINVLRSRQCARFFKYDTLLVSCSVKELPLHSDAKKYKTIAYENSLESFKVTENGQNVISEVNRFHEDKENVSKCGSWEVVGQRNMRGKCFKFKNDIPPVNQHLNGNSKTYLSKPNDQPNKGGCANPKSSVHAINLVYLFYKKNFFFRKKQTKSKQTKEQISFRIQK